MQEEVFGPVFVLQPFGNPTMSSKSDVGFDEDELLKTLNDVNFGLSAVLFTENKKFANSFAKKIETGSVFINHPSTSTSEFPFGGVKRSGFGRECGPFAISTFGQVKSVNLSGCGKKFQL